MALTMPWLRRRHRYGAPAGFQHPLSWDNIPEFRNLEYKMEDFEDRILGETAGPVALETKEQNRLAVLALTRQAKRRLDIFTRHLDPAIYDDPPFLEALAALALRSRYSEIRFLVHDTERAVQEVRRLLELSQRLSSFVQLRTPNEDYKDYNEAFCIADERGVLHRTLSDRYEGSVDFDAPLHAQRLRAFFNTVWEKAELDPNLRRLHI